MSGHPIQYHADSVAMAVVDKISELGRFAMARGGRVVADGLITPAPAIGVLGNREQFDVGVSNPFDVFDQFMGKLAISQITVALLGCAHPRTEVHLVD